MRKESVKNIFVSANTSEFAYLRKVVSGELLRKSCMPIAMDHFSTSNGNLKDLLTKEIAKSDAVICLIGNSFGAQVPTPPGEPIRSYTQLEFDLAKKMGKPTFIFIKREYEEGNMPHDHLQKIYRNSFKGGSLVWHSFSAEEDLCRQILGIDFSSLATSSAKSSPKWYKLGKIFLLCFIGLAVIGVGLLIYEKVKKDDTTTDPVTTDNPKPDPKPDPITVPEPTPPPPKEEQDKPVNATVIARPSIEGATDGEIRAFSIGAGVMMNFAWVGPGEFMMGNEGENAPQSETPARKVKMSGFWMARDEFNEDAWSRLSLLKQKTINRNSKTMPITSVSYRDVQQVLKTINEEVSIMNELPDRQWHFDMPSEAQWEYAYEKNGGALVATSDSPIRHLEGGVGEWCKDGYQDTLASLISQVVDPIAPENGGKYVIRDVQSNQNKSNKQLKTRYNGTFSETSPQLGFRIVLTKKIASKK